MKKYMTVRKKWPSTTWLPAREPPPLLAPCASPHGQVRRDRKLHTITQVYTAVQLMDTRQRARQKKTKKGRKTYTKATLSNFADQDYKDSLSGEHD